MRLWLAALGLAASLAGAPAAEHLPGEAIVIFRAAPPREAARSAAKPPDPDAARAALHRRLGCRVLDRLPDLRAERVGLPAGADLDAVLAQYRQDPLVRSAQPNWVLKALACALPPSDPYYFASTQVAQTGLLMTAWPQAYAAWCAGSIALASLVKVAVLDTGVNAVPELAGQLLAGADYTGSPGGSGDDNGHGTAVAGVIAAATDNGLGLAGAFFAGSLVRLLPVKVLDQAGNGNEYSIVQGMQWALGQGARVLNLSLGYGVPGELMEAAVASARQRGALVVAAAGNQGLETAYPAAFPSAFAVAALALSNAATDYSNGGKLELAAPGGDGAGSCACTAAPGPGCPGEAWVLCNTGGLYQAVAGTSFAAPLVAAAAALLLSQDSARTPEDLHLILTRSADPTAQGPGWHRETGWGRLNFYKALTYGRGAPSPGGEGLRAYNWPNPFNPVREGSTRIHFELKAPGEARLRMVDAGGALVWEKAVAASATYAGANTVLWDGRNSAGILVANGAYTLVLEAEGSRAVVMVAVLR